MVFVYLISGLVFLVLVYILICYFLSNSVLFLAKQPLPKNPGDYGLEFEDIEFKAEDGVNIKGWLITGSTDKIVIITHPGGFTKYGYTTEYRGLFKFYDREIEFIKTAAQLNKKGYWVLMFDFRNHGQSGKSPNEGKTGVGREEYRDVLAALDYIRNDKKLDGFSTGFVSLCMGANSTIVAMGNDPTEFEMVKCMVAVQPISALVFARSYLKTLVYPLGVKILFPMIKKFVDTRSAYPMDKMSPKEFIKDIKVPVLYIQARNDPWTELHEIKGFYNDTPGTKEFFWIEDTKHRFESYSYFQEKPEKVLEWLGKWM